MTVTIMIRWYAGDRQQHAYPANQLDNGRPHLTPMCAQPPVQDRRHPRNQIGKQDLPSFGGLLDRCPGCAVSTRRNSHTIIVRGQVFV